MNFGGWAVVSVWNWSMVSAVAQPTTMNCGVVTIPDICQTSRIVAAPGFIRVNFMNTNQIGLVMKNKIRHHDTIAPPAQRRLPRTIRRSLRFFTGGGSTPSVLQQIQNTWPQEAWDLRNDLMAMAPFVSREALEEAALMCILPDAMLLEICLANPDATRSQEFLDFLAQGTPCPLPQYMIDIVQDNWDVETSRTLLEKGLARYGAERDFYTNALIRNSRFQDEYTLANLIEWHEERASLSDYYSMADIYIEYQKFDSAEIVLDNIPLDFVLDDDQTIGHNNYLDYFDFMESLYLNNKTIHDIDSLERIALQAIANEPLGFATTKAHNMINTIDGTCEEYYGYVSGAQPKAAQAIDYDPTKVLDEFYNHVSCIPNPAKDFAIFEWELMRLETTAQLTITDLKGIVVGRHLITSMQGTWTFDIRMLAEGIYIYEIVAVNKQLAYGKLVISKN